MNKNNNIIQEEKIITQKKETFFTKFESKVKKQILQKLAFFQLKAIFISLIGMLIPYIIVLVSILLMSFVMIFLFFSYVNYGNYQYVNSINNITNQDGKTPGLLDYLRGGKDSFTSTDAKAFNSTSKIPHGFPVTGTLTQLFCSNFYTGGKISYSPHKGNFDGKLYFEYFCQEKMKLNPKLADFATNYAGGNWQKVGSHGGIDIGAKEGTVILSMSKGEVTSAGTKGLWGNRVDVRSYDSKTNKTYIIRYAHLSSISVSKGDEILAGQTIGKVGNTGFSFGAHLHYSICESDEPNIIDIDTCYSNPSEKYKIVDPFFYSFNFILNGKKYEDLEKDTNYNGFQSEYLRTQIKSGIGSPGEKIDYINFNTYVFDGNEIVDEEIRDYVYIKVGLEEDVNPLAIKTLHYRERGGGLTNPQPKNSPGWSGENEGVYGFFSDFSSLGPFCNRTIDNFGPFGQQLNYSQFYNQTLCAAKALQHKAKTVNNGLKIVSVDGFSLDKSNWDNICSVIAKWNAGSFYCYNKLYPKYTNDSKYEYMNVIIGGKMAGKNRQDGFLKFALDNYNSFQQIFEKYKNGGNDKEK